MINMFLILKQFVQLFFQKRRGSALLEEILLIGIAIFVFIIIFGIVLNLINWSTNSIEDLFN